MRVNKEDVEMIVDTVPEAFDRMESLRCDTIGLFEYIKDCNEIFIKKKYEPQRLCYSVVFLNEAKKRGIVLNKKQEEELLDDAKQLAEKYPEYNNEIHKYVDTAQ